jgi:hypothetical protein
VSRTEFDRKKKIAGDCYAEYLHLECTKYHDRFH